MIHFHIITIFSEIFTSYMGESLIARALQKKLISIGVHNLRDFADYARGTVDGRPVGGGAGDGVKSGTNL